MDSKIQVVNDNPDEASASSKASKLVDALDKRFEQSRQVRDEDELFGIPWSTDISNE